MSELKAYRFLGQDEVWPDANLGSDYYLKSEADKVIAEKDKEIAELKKKLMPCLNGDCILTCEVVEKYGKENAELKAENAQLMKEMKFMHSNCKWHVGDGCYRLLGEKLAIIDDNVKLKQKLEDAKATAYTESVDAGMRERRLERAIWLARAERYKMKEFIAREEGNLSNQMSWSRILRDRTYNQWVDQLLRIANLANKLQNKCRAKAEEYK